jgi:phospholipase C
LALGAPPDPTHSHKAFATEFAKGKLNGFASETCGPHCGPNIAYSYVTPSDVAQYYAMAEEFAFADHNMQPNEGPSLPAHLYLLAGQSTSTPPWSISENPKTPKKKDAQNCLAPAGSTVEQINMSTSFPGTEGDLIFPCIDQTTILDELQSAGLTWRYYTPNLGSLWTAPCAIEHFYCASNPNVVVPETTVLTDIANNQLADVSYVVPREVNSDHPGKGITGGPAWVSAVVDAVGQSPYWSNTAIVVEWDDWGGWYDHYLFGTNGHPAFAPKDPYEYGLRVPLMVISPYAAGGGSGYISHTPRDSTSILHFIEDVYGLPSLGQLDSHTDDLFELFDFNESPIPFTPFAQPGDHSIQQYRMLPPDPTPVDDD